jgi:hypothetical protein
MNVKPAPFMLNESSVRELLGSALLGGSQKAGIVSIPVMPLRLVDRPRRSEDPRLARANDDGGAL